jgi:hypothetical protein
LLKRKRLTVILIGFIRYIVPQPQGEKSPDQRIGPFMAVIGDEEASDECMDHAGYGPADRRRGIEMPT